MFTKISDDNSKTINLISNENSWKISHPDFYEYINTNRGSISEKISSILIFWMQEGDIKDFAKKAPDTWHYRSGVFDLTTKRGIKENNQNVFTSTPTGFINSLYITDKNIKSRIEDINKYLYKEKNISLNLKIEFFDEFLEFYFKNGNFY